MHIEAILIRHHLFNTYWNHLHQTPHFIHIEAIFTRHPICHVENGPSHVQTQSLTLCIYLYPLLRSSLWAGLLKTDIEAHVKLEYKYLIVSCSGLDPFGFPTIERSWDDGSNSLENAKRRLQVAFEFMDKLGVKYWTFHDRYDKSFIWGIIYRSSDIFWWGGGGVNKKQSLMETGADKINMLAMDKYNITINRLICQNTWLYMLLSL